MIQETRLENNYWVIGGNKWSSSMYTKKQAEMLEKTLDNCHNCINCSYCKNCWYCVNCIDCQECRQCSGCKNCAYCTFSLRCKNCRSCHHCHFCDNFKSNPQQMTSPRLGKDKNIQVKYFWNNKSEQVVCRFFVGSLCGFEEKVKERHGDTESAQGYLDWVESVKNYKLTYGGNNEN